MVVISGGHVVKWLFIWLALSAFHQPKWEAVKSEPCLECTRLAGQLRGKHPLDQLHAVNDHFNRVAYIEDQQDIWQPPDQFVKNGGDCEDYAIAKYRTLKLLGHDARINVMQGLHAVTDVKLYGVKYRLDNRNPSISDYLPHETIYVLQ